MAVSNKKKICDSVPQKGKSEKKNLKKAKNFPKLVIVESSQIRQSCQLWEKLRDRIQERYNQVEKLIGTRGQRNITSLGTTKGPHDSSQELRAGKQGRGTLCQPLMQKERAKA